MKEFPAKIKEEQKNLSGKRKKGVVFFLISSYYGSQGDQEKRRTQRKSFEAEQDVVVGFYRES